MSNAQHFVVEPRADASPSSRADVPVSGFFDVLVTQPPDALLALIGAFRDDPRAGKIDVGVGVYRDEHGMTPVFKAIKDAERSLVESQTTKSYLGPEGDVGYLRAISAIALGEARSGHAGVTGLQTPGGTGALRLAAELIARTNPAARVFVGVPTWPNHAQILDQTRLRTVSYKHCDVAAQTMDFDAVMAALRQGGAGDVALLHGCCHNPTGIDFDPAQWWQLAALLAERRMLPLLDLAYQGLGGEPDDDAAGIRTVVDTVETTLIAYSCDKNFGLYRERTGALLATTRTAAERDVVQSNLLALARANWSMPPDHGAAAVRIVLTDAGLRATWLAELADVRRRLRQVRERLADAHPVFAPLRRQYGLFATLNLTPDQVRLLREAHAIYMPASGRINLAGLTSANIARFVSALAPLLEAD